MTTPTDADAAPRTPGARRPLRWIELTPDYRCNNACVGCFSVDADGPSMSSREAVAALVRGRGTGASWLWLGGGEPTLRRDLLPLIREARRLGYDRIRLQTNAMMFAYDEFARRVAEAGATELSLSIKGATAATHDAFARTPGTFDLMLRGAENARRHGLALEADVLVYATNVHEIPDVVRTFHALGVARFRLWMLSVATDPDPELRTLVPRMAAVVPQVVAAMDLGLSDDPEFIVSLHTPPCTLPATHRGARFDPAAFALLVMNPGGHAFRLEESPIEGGRFLPACDRCAFRDRCGGLRGDYLAIHGTDEFVPVVDATDPPTPR